MNILVLLFVLVTGVSTALAQTPAAPQGDAQRGKQAWGVNLRCMNCHGTAGEGGFGPDLAGRNLTFDQFRRAVRDPWGVMLAYTERQLSDQTLADMFAYMNSLPRVAEPAKPPFKAPPGAPLGQVYIVETIGCANCHEPELRQARRNIGAEAADVDLEYFKRMIYRHQEVVPTGRMGNYRETRLPLVVLQEIFKFVKDDLGLLVPIAANMDAGKPDGANTAYTLTVKNIGKAGKGLTAEDVTVTIKLADGVMPASATGTGKQQTAPGAITWKLDTLTPQQELKFVVTLAGTPGQPATALFKGSRVDYEKPGMRKGVPNLQLVDERWEGSKNDWQPVSIAQPQQTR